jgi:phosphotransferase family enzyme
VPPGVSALRLPSPAQAGDPEALAALTGSIQALEVSKLDTVGLTGARHERLGLTLQSGERCSLVVKRVRLSVDWIACRTSDRRGREAAMLEEPALGAMWDAFICPYRAYAMGRDEIALVMDDLSSHFLPDVREPVEERQEEALLTGLATLHARFWGSPALDLPWLTRTEHYAGVLDPHCASDASARAPLPQAMCEALMRGWAIALPRLSAGAARLVSAPAVEMAGAWATLPRTLLHGDSKVANFALFSDHRVAAIDWALIGAGPPTIDLGWYLAVNASRLTRSKEDTIRRYRALLEESLPSPIPDALWDALIRTGIVAGARMLLWSKALAVDAGRPGAQAEWSWWAERLDAAGS